MEKNLFDVAFGRPCGKRRGYVANLFDVASHVKILFDVASPKSGAATADLQVHFWRYICLLEQPTAGY